MVAMTMQVWQALIDAPAYDSDREACFKWFARVRFYSLWARVCLCMCACVHVHVRVCLCVCNMYVSAYTSTIIHYAFVKKLILIVTVGE